MKVKQPNPSFTSVLPFLKWPGGKRWACPIIVPLIRQLLHGIYYEPFLGGGAVYFALQPERAVLSDVNPEIINVFQQVTSNHKKIIAKLKRLPVDSKTYYELRAETDRHSSLSRAVRFLYLNRTAFGGIYRVNRSGEVNVPFGGGERTPAILWEQDILERAASLLQSATVKSMKFEEALANAGQGDVVYCDPTYSVAHNNNGFCRYNERNFTWSDQERLSNLSKKAAERGATILVSNACHEEVRRLYRPHQEVKLKRMSCVSRDPSWRREVEESLFIIRH